MGGVLGEGAKDVETWGFSESTNVICFLCRRNANISLTMVQHIKVSVEFMHHQKDGHSRCQWWW